MGISLNTLRTYWRRIREKVGEGSRSALAVAYVENLAKSPQTSDFDPDWEVDLKTRVWKRLSLRPMPAIGGFGYTVPLDEVLSSMHPEDEPRVREMINGLDPTTTYFSYVARMITSNGQTTAGAFVRVIRDEHGTPIKLLGRRSPAYNLVADGPVFSDAQTHEGWIYEPKTGKLHASDEINRMLGLTVGQPHDFEEYARPFVREDFERGRLVLERISAKEIKSATYDLHFLDPSATQMIRVFVNGIHNQSGEVVRIIGYRTWVGLGGAVETRPAVPTVQVGFWAKDLRSGSFLKPDGDFCKIYRVDPNSATLDQDIRSRYLPADAGPAYDFIDEAVAAGETRGSRSFELVFEDGSRQWIRLEFFIETDREGFSRINGTVLAFER